ncbi:MAG: lipoyl(octanoyl) transferase LipB [Cyclobacteriaceae bacterium]|nr:lipoyl(octanoyl) transferase LipB [Cyclobacteriaceae bacterium]
MNSNINKTVTLINIGMFPYKEAWDYQAFLFNQILEIKSGNRNIAVEEQKETPNYLITCEHPPVYTLGKSGDEKNLLLDNAQLQNVGATYFHINRGGDITFHGPGQLVVYPIIDLENFFTDIHQYMRLLEEAVILTCKDFGIEAGRIKGLTGVWIGEGDSARKICAMGVKTSRWVTMHGLALNVNTDLNFFNHIVPCGISDKAVTSMQQELKTEIDFEAVRKNITQHLAQLFGFDLKITLS